MSKEINEEVLALIEKAIKEIGFGSVTLVLQDARIIQMEKLEKIRFGEKPAKCTNRLVDIGSFKTRILQSVSGMEYGKVAIQIQAGQIMQIERTEKYRVGKLTGLNGDGI